MKKLKRKIEDEIRTLIYTFRGQRVMLDLDLARLYGVSTKRLNESVKRNRERFPSDFLFELNIEEFRRLAILRSQFATSRLQLVEKTDDFGEISTAEDKFVLSQRMHGGHRYRTYAFTEHGVAMLSSVLNSPQAIQVNIEIMRAFVDLRHILSEHRELAKRLEELESKYDSQFKVVFTAIRELMDAPVKKKRRIGFD